jgi:acyl carrier protein
MQTLEEIQTEIAEIVNGIFLEPADSKRDVSFAGDCSAGLLDMVEIVVALEDRFGIEIPDEDVAAITGTGAAAEYILRRLKETNEWLKQE